MHPDLMLEIARFHIEELHAEAARARLVKEARAAGGVPRASQLWTGLGFGKLRSKTALSAR